MAKPSITGVPPFEHLLAQTEISLDVGKLNNALALHPGRFAWWAWQEVLARQRMRQFRAALDEHDRTVKECEARLYQHFEMLPVADKGELRGRSRGGMTVDAIKASVASHPDRTLLDAVRLQLQQQFDNATLDAEQLKVGRETMRDQKDVLMEIARNLRDELHAGASGMVREGAEHSPAVLAAQQREREAIRRRQR